MIPTLNFSDVLVYTWGQADQGQLGNGANEDKLDPVIVEGFQSDVVELAAGDKHCLAVTGTELIIIY